MGKGDWKGLFDLEKHFAFYGAYHSNPANVTIHTLLVWPIFFTALILCHFTPPLLILHHHLSLFSDININIGIGIGIGFFFALLYSLFYFLMDNKAGSLAALLCLLCWIGSDFLAAQLGFSLAWKVSCYRGRKASTKPSLLHLQQSQKPSSSSSTIPLLKSSNSIDSNLEEIEICFFHVLWITRKVVLSAQLVCWTGQFIGHGVFEKRAPALMDNLSQALLMAPFFVLLEVLQSLLGYEPYPGFHASVKAKIDADRKEWEASKQKKAS